jgi:cytochrome c peroxidase
MCGQGLLAGLYLSITVVQSAAGARDLGFTESEKQRILRHSPLPPVPIDETNQVADDPRAVLLGQFLFFDERLSTNGKVSCATCHDPRKAFADEKPVAEGIAQAARHTPALWNVAYNRWFFWDGRADSLWAQALQPIENPVEMGFSRLGVMHHIARDRPLREAYESVFGLLPDVTDSTRFPAKGRPVADQPDHPEHRAWQSMSESDRHAANAVMANVAKAIAAYERKLVSRDSPFDRFAAALRSNDLKGVAEYPDAAKRGLNLFFGRGNCRFCHGGPNFTDGEFHTTRIPPRGGGPARDAARYDGVELVKRDPFSAAGRYSANSGGPGAEKIETLVNKPDNWGLFKTPSLRNVARTAPYMHQGQFATLREVLQFYSTFDGALPPDHHARETILRPLNMSDAEMDDLIAFLESLTDTAIDPKLMKRPNSPLRE